MCMYKDFLPQKMKHCFVSGKAAMATPLRSVAYTLKYASMYKVYNIARTVSQKYFLKSIFLMIILLQHIFLTTEINRRGIKINCLQ